MSPATSGDVKSRLEKDVSDWLLVPFALGGLAATVALAGVALWEIGAAAVQYVSSSASHESDPLRPLVAHVLKGVELLFLAPLAYLVVLILGDYLRCIVVYSPRTDKVHEEVLDLKCLTTSLLIAVVATDLVQKVLSESGLTPDAAVYEGLVVVTLALFLAVLQRRPKSPHASPSTPGDGSRPSVAAEPGAGVAAPTP